MSKSVDSKTKAPSPRVPVTVMGQDIDRGLITSLSAANCDFAGDKVMVEINGKRIFSAQSCPLIAELPWEVIQNDENALKLKHPNCDHVLVLSWSELLKSRRSEPAVFVTGDLYFSNKPLFVILQFAAYRTYSNVVAETIKAEWDVDAWDSFISDSFVRRATLEKIVRDLSQLKHPGWGWKTACRFALRSDVKLNVINAFRTGDWYKINQQDNAVILKILGVLRWMQAYQQQCETVLINSKTTDELKDDDDSAGGIEETKDIQSH